MANAIEVENVKKRFGDFVAVNGISFSVEQGQIFAFLGPNGAGKTTTIKMLTTVLAPSEGRAPGCRSRPRQGAAPGAQRLWHRLPGPEP
jgi:ABC-type multidrug transport system ATPase subunit